MKTFTNYAEKKAKQILNLLQGYTKGIRLTAILILLLMGTSNAWAWQSWYLYGEYQGSWDTNKKKNLSGTIENGKYFIAVYHPGSTKYFRLYSNNHYGPSSSKALPSGGEQGGYNGSSDSWYISTTEKGLLRISIDQTNGKEWSPWVWWERSDVRLKHQWTSDTWTYSSRMTDKKDGTYTLTTEYPSRTGGYNYSDYSGNGSYDVGWISSPTIEGSPAAGNKCLYTLNTNNATLTITKLCSLTYNGNGATGGTVPSAVTNKTYNTSITLSSTVLTKNGYTHIGWNTKADGSGTTYNLGASLTLTDASLTLYAQWEANTYTVTLNNQSATNAGTTSVTATYGSAMPSITVPTRTGYTFGGYYTATNGGGTKYYKADGSSAKNWDKTAATILYAQWTAKDITINWNANGGSVTPISSTYTYDGDAITLPTPSYAGHRFLGWYTAASGGTQITDVGTTNKPYTTVTYYAHWEVSIVEHTVTFAVGTGSTEYGTLTAATNSGNITSGSNIVEGTSVTFTATPETGYEVEGWYTNAACTEGKHDAGSTTYTISITGVTNVYVKFVEKKWSVAFTAGTGGFVTTPSSTPKTVGQVTGISIAATPATGYTFNQWTITSGAGSFTSEATTNSNTFKPTNNSTVTASFNETMSTLTTSNKYDVGNPEYAIPTKSVNSIGVATTATVTATAASNGYTFAGWKLDNCVRTDAGADNATTITVKSNGDGKAATVVANYAEDLTTSWVLKGSFVDDFKTAYDFVKKSGESTGTVAYVTLELAANTAYQFKVVNGSTWYGNNNSDEKWWIKATTNDWVFYSDAGNCHMKSSVAGTYTFKIDFSGTDPKVSVQFPTAYTLTYGSGAGGSGTVTADNSIKSGDLVLAGTSVSLTATPADGYDFAAWYSDEACEGAAISSNNPYTFSINSNTTLYAKWKAQSFTLTWDLNGGRIIEDGTPEGSVETGTTLEPPIVEKDYYDFASWNPTVPKTMPAAHVTYTAQWTPKKYTITYRDQGDKAFSGTHANGYPTTHTYNTTTTLLGATKNGYTFAGWYRDSECAGARVETLGVGVTEAITLYAKWDVASYTINFDPEGGTGGTTTELTVPFGAQLPNITIPTKAGYLFLGYYDGDNGTGTQYYDASGKGLQTMPANNLTLHAKWLNGSDCIFFYNNLGWSNVYVYFYNNADGHNYWADGYGTGANKQQKFWENNPYYEMEHGTMTQIKGTNIWYYYATYIKTNQRSKVSFANVNQSCDKEANNTNSYFQNAKVVYRADLDYEKRLPMFVPHATQSHYFSNTKSTYYNNGYWMNYPENTGYKLHIFDENGNKINDQLVDIPFEYGDNTIMPWSVSVSLEGATTYAFKIQRADNQWYGNNGTMTTNSSGDVGQTAWEFTTGTNNCKITTTAPGTYVFTLKYGKDRNSNYNYLVGVEYPASVGDYRLAYDDDTHPFHPGHLLKKRDGKDTVSFFVHHDQDLHPVIMLQEVTEIDAQTGDITWNTISTTENLNGISATGIYNFILLQEGNEAQIDAAATHLYSGNFYIRTDATAGGWGNFRQNSNKMTYTSYAENQEKGFNHYFVEWINAGTNVKFTIANDYSYCLSDSLDADDIVTTGNLPANANVRFGWHSKTNKLTRAYISGSSNVADRYLVLTGDDKLTDMDDKHFDVDGLHANEAIFKDMGNWIYQLDAKAGRGASIQLTARYNEKDQTFFNTSAVALTEEGNETTYPVRFIYDFKTNNLMAAWLLEENQNDIAGGSNLNANMLLLRRHHDQAQQIQLSNTLSSVGTAYGVMTFEKDFVNDTKKSIYERALYWVSFPFDVRIRDVFGFGEYMDTWIMEYYDGEARAKNGAWVDSESYWTYITDLDSVLRAGVGYVLCLDLDKMGDDSKVFENTSEVSLYFPSKEPIGNIDVNQAVSITVPEYKCAINRQTPQGDRRIADSNWNVIGVPRFINLDITLDGGTIDQQNIVYYYQYNASNNTYQAAVNSGEQTFQTMQAYMVQYAGTIDWWEMANWTPQQLAARRNANATSEKVNLRLEIAQDDVAADKTFIQLQEEGATADFDMNKDLTKIINAGTNIYTIVGEGNVLTAGNVMPMSECVVPVGVKVDAEGEYTFRMPDGTEGMVVELIDYKLETKTNLLLFDYTVDLSAGTCNDRFALHIQPNKSGVTTGVENVGDKAKGIEKYLIDGKLMIRTAEGVIYDAQGHVVQ